LNGQPVSGMGYAQANDGDLVSGGPGHDILDSGEGADIFGFAPSDAPVAPVMPSG